MDCRGIRKHLNDYVDDLLDRDLKLEMDEHLKTCPACSEELAVLQALRRRMSTLSRMSPPTDFLHRVHRKLEQEGMRSRRVLFGALFRPARIRVPVSLAALATAVVALIFVVNIMVPRSQKRPESVKKAVPGAAAPWAEEKEISSEEAQRPSAVTAAPEQEAQEPSLKRAEPSRMELETGTEGDELMSLETEAAREPEPIVGTHEKPEKMRTASIPGPAVKAPLEITLLIRPRPYTSEVQPSGGEEPPLQDLGKRESESPYFGKEKGTYRSSKADIPSDEYGASPQPQLSILPLIEDILQDLGGRVMSIDYGDDPDLPRSISVEIPTAGFDDFSAALRSLGEIVAGEPATLQDDVPDTQPLSIRILLRTPSDR